MRFLVIFSCDVGVIRKFMNNHKMVIKFQYYIGKICWQGVKLSLPEYVFKNNYHNKVGQGLWATL